MDSMRRGELSQVTEEESEVCSLSKQGTATLFPASASESEPELMALKRKKERPMIIHHQKYLKYQIQSQKLKKDEIFSIIRYLQNNQIKCFKYNYSLDQESSSESSFQSLLCLSMDETVITIKNRKPQ